MCLAAKCIGSRHCTAAFVWQVPKLCTDPDQTLLYMLILRTYTKFVWKNKMLRSGVGSRSPARALAAGLPHQDTTDESFRFHNKNIDQMRCKLDSTENLRSFEKYLATTQRKKSS